jgi:hypothetical protein
MEHPSLPEEKLNFRQLSQIMKEHPSLVSEHDLRRLEAWQRRQRRIKTLRQAKRCRKSLEEFASDVGNPRDRALFAGAAEVLGDVLWRIREVDSR